MKTKALLLGLMMIFIILNPSIGQNNQLEHNNEVQHSSSSNPQFLSNSGFISRNSGFEIWDAVSENNTIYMAVTARYTTTFANITLSTGGYVLEFDPINNTVTNSQYFSAEVRAIKQNQTSLLVLVEGFTPINAGNSRVSNIYAMDKDFTNLTTIGTRSGTGSANVIDIHLTNSGVVYLGGSFSSDIQINNTVFSVKSQNKVSFIRYNLTNSSDNQINDFSANFAWGGWHANRHFEIPRISPESNSTQLVGVYQGNGFSSFCIGYQNTICQTSGSAGNDNYLQYKPGKIVNSTLIGLDVNTCQSELAGGGNNFFSASFVNINELSFDPTCGTQSELGKLSITHYATNLTKEIIFDPLKASSANTINYAEGGLLVGLFPFDNGVFAFHNNLDYSSYYGFTEVPVVSGNLISTYLIDSDGDDVADFNDDFPLDSTQTKDSDGDGYGDNPLGINGDDCPLQIGNSTEGLVGCFDIDGDNLADQLDAFPQINTQKNDSDRDGYGDNSSIGAYQTDACPLVYGTSTKDIFGCLDSDNDGYSDLGDEFDSVSSQWTDTDGDGYGDEFVGFQGDACPQDFGLSFEDKFGCADSDNDGWSDDVDAFPFESTQYSDRDLDGYGDNQSLEAMLIDAFPSDTTQWNDTDKDGYGDNEFGTQGDKFPNDPARWQDSDNDGISDSEDAFPYDPTQSTDSDQDGYGDDPYGKDGDWFPYDPSRWEDSDRDGVADEDDAFPNDSSQIIDLDDDGYGDDANGSDPDVFPDDPTEWADTDGDEVGNNADAFPFDPSQQNDSDGDGFGDNERGSGADKFPNDSTQWSDIDGDGYGDNQDGTNPDAFIADPTQWADADEDGYGDNPTGRQADAFTNDATQWLDQDGDGLGDNLSGNNPDPYLFDFDNDGYNDSIDPLPKLASPGDLDNDGTPDVDDLFPEDFREWADADGDGEGDNADTDDDNDGWADTDEVRLGTDPFGAADVPIDSFEIVIPGTAVGLGAWDLIGMFGGIPLFMWIGFGFVTRNGRTAKYEGLLREAQSRDELEDVARMWEYSLMLRMLGPHQGIRLERLRAELDDRFEAQNQTLSSIEPEQHDQTQMVEQAMHETTVQEEAKLLPSIESTVPNIDVQGNPDGKGYEWHSDGQGTSWYRNEGSNSEWQRFEV